jgi:isopenicillin-N epimerase
VVGCRSPDVVGTEFAPSWADVDNGPMDYRELWTLDPAIDFLNHGSFGACPRAVLERQAELRAEMEREPVRFLMPRIDGLAAESMDELARLLGASAEDLAFVTNATTGVNTVLRWFPLRPEDELLTTDHAYNACRNALEAVAGPAGATVVVAHVPFPLNSEDEVVEAILAGVTPRTRLALIDHVTSPTALVLPIERIVHELAARGVETLVDGAHAPGMVPLDLASLGAAFYTGNGHKWLCAPKGVGFLYVRRDWQDRIRPLVISHGANRPLDGASRFQREFAWQGTGDPTPALCLGEAIRFMGSLLPGGWDELRQSNREKALRGRAAICQRLGIELPCPASMVGSMATVPLPDSVPQPAREGFVLDPIGQALIEQWRIEVPVLSWPARPKRQVRISAQLYNQPEQYERLADALAALL